MSRVSQSVRAGAGKGLAIGGREGMERLHSLVVLFSESMFVVMVPVMPRSNHVQDLVSHSSYNTCHQSCLLISLRVMVRLLTGMELLVRA